jgi:hypothetical protein
VGDSDTECVAPLYDYIPDDGQENWETSMISYHFEGYDEDIYEKYPEVIFSVDATGNIGIMPSSSIGPSGSVSISPHAFTEDGKCYGKIYGTIYYNAGAEQLAVTTNTISVTLIKPEE